MAFHSLKFVFFFSPMYIDHNTMIIIQLFWFIKAYFCFSILPNANVRGKSDFVLSHTHACGI